MFETFEEWFEAQGFENFKAHEFTNYFKRPKNTYPPSGMWDRMVPGLRVLDELRNVLQSPITITSSYRSPAYNSACGGVVNSQHVMARAFDFQVKNFTPHEVMAILKDWRQAGMFKGGLGLYPTFCHLDTRGWNATW